MPTYSYKCHACKRKFDRILPLARYDEPQFCTCPSEEPAVKQLTPVAVAADYPAYHCPVTGKLVEGRKAHEENLKRTGCRILEPGETDAAKRVATRSEVELEKALDATVEQFIDELPQAKKEQLCNEAEAGVSLDVVRL